MIPSSLSPIWRGGKFYCDLRTSNKNCSTFQMKDAVHKFKIARQLAGKLLLRYLPASCVMMTPEREPQAQSTALTI